VTCFISGVRPPETDLHNNRAVTILAAYSAAGAVLALGRVVMTEGSLVTVAAYVAVLAAVIATWNTERRSLLFLRDWLPLLSLPVLYAAIPTTSLRVGPFDAIIQGVDRSIFGSDVAHTFGGAVQSRAVSEVLHGAYLSYYLIIYLPPLLMYARGSLDDFRRTVLAFTLAMTVCFAVFWFFPVEGPRYAWPPPPGVPEGFFRQVALTILERGSSRGAAFPSSHQAIALAMALSSLQWNRRVGTVVLALTIFLGLGAVYGGFHYATDMMVGAVVGAGSWIVVRRRAAGPG
jgi:membrane-associated phospholipid phosphatase